MTSLINVEDVLDGMCRELQDLLKQRGISDPALIGIRTGGVWLADYIHRKLGLKEPFGQLDISFYRDDFTRIGLNPTVRPSSLPLETEGRHIVLVDDVVMSGRTIRAAMNEIFDYGRPASIILAALVDLGARELPIQPDVVGRRMQLERNQKVKLRGPQSLSLELREKKSSHPERA